MTNTNKLLADFNRYFTSGNDVDVPARVSVPRDEWRELHAALAQSGQGEVLGFAWRAKGSSDKWKFCGDIKQRPDLSQEADAKRFVNTEIVDLFTRPQPAQPSSEDVRELTKWLNEESTAPINKQALARVLAAQPARVVGTVTGYQTASGAQQWQFNPSNVAGLESQRFDVALSTPTASKEEQPARVVDDSTLDTVCERHSAALLAGLTSRKAMRRALETFLSAPTAAPTPSQEAVTELETQLADALEKAISGMRLLLKVQSDTAAEYAVSDSLIQALAAYAKKAGA